MVRAVNRLYVALIILLMALPVAAAPPEQETLPPTPIQLSRPEPTVQVLGSVPLQRISAYNPLPWQTDADPYTSSCGPNRPDQIALSQDLFFENGRKICGTEVTLLVVEEGRVVESYDRVVWDTMNIRYTATADMYLPEDRVEEAMAWGVRRGLLVFR